MANTEQIEAKLCAYVDGELDPGERAEIEQHLAANPQHRQLLDELMAQRQLLKDLPREKAPVDLFDSFQTQLERSVLLDTKPLSSQVAGRINPWPQVFSIAAVMLLAVGLFAVIYFVLPDQSNDLKDYALVPSTTPARETLADATTPARSAASPRIPADEESTTRPETIALGKGGFTLPRENVLGEKGVASDGYLNAAGDIFDAPPLEPEIAQRVQESSQVPQKSMLLVFACADPSAADKQVTTYLAENSIRWGALPEPMPQPPAVTGGIYASKIQSRSYEFQGAGNRPEAKAEQSQKKLALDDKAKSDASEKSAEDVNQASAAATPPPPAAVPASPPAPAPARERASAEQSVATSTTTRPDIFAQQTQVEAIDGLTPGSISNQAAAAQSVRCIVARGLTRAQVAELNSSIIAQNTGKLSNYYRSGSSITPTQPALATSLNMQVRQQAASATQEIRRERQVLEGTLDARKETDAASTQPAQDRTQELSKAAAPTTAATISTQDSTGTAIAHEPATTRVAAVAATGATTAPTSAPAVEEERVDVVIVMKPDVVTEQLQVAEPPQTQPAATVPAQTP